MAATSRGGTHLRHARRAGRPTRGTRGFRRRITGRGAARPGDGRNCLVGRVEAAGLAEDLVARLGTGDRAELTEREAAVVDFAHRFGADHRSLGEADLRRLHELFDQEEIAEIGMLCARFLGFGRVAMVDGLETPVLPDPGAARARAAGLRRTRP